MYLSILYNFEEINIFYYIHSSLRNIIIIFILFIYDLFYQESRCNKMMYTDRFFRDHGCVHVLNSL